MLFRTIEILYHLYTKAIFKNLQKVLSETGDMSSQEMNLVENLLTAGHGTHLRIQILANKL